MIKCSIHFMKPEEILNKNIMVKMTTILVWIIHGIKFVGVSVFIFFFYLGPIDREFKSKTDHSNKKSFPDLEKQ